MTRIALALIASLALATPALAGSDGPSPFAALEALAGPDGSATQTAPVVVERVLSAPTIAPDAVTVVGYKVRDTARDLVLLDVSLDGEVRLASLGATGRQARASETFVGRTPDDRPLYTLSESALGARVLVIEAGVLGPRALHFTAFDNEDVHFSDDEGQVLYSRRTLEDGALLETATAPGLCACERVTRPDGRALVRALSR